MCAKRFLKSRHLIAGAVGWGPVLRWAWRKDPGLGHRVPILGVFKRSHIARKKCPTHHDELKRCASGRLQAISGERSLGIANGGNSYR